MNSSRQTEREISPSTPASLPSEYSREERALLLRVAHDAILAALENRTVSLEAPTPHLAEPRGVFTTLHMHDELRGCVGYVLPSKSVYRAVAETAQAAAFSDTRFYPVTHEEALALEIELSVLSAPQPIRPEDVEVGRHGLLISAHGRRGLLLPQVAPEHSWDRVTFLDQTCRKAGLPLDSWKRDAKVEAFTAEIFGDRDASSQPGS